MHYLAMVHHFEWLIQYSVLQYFVQSVFMIMSRVVCDRVIVMVMMTLVYCPY